MTRLSWVLLFMTLMVCSATSPKKEMDEAKMLANTDESMTRGSWFNLSLSYDIGSLIKKKIQIKKKLISAIFGKKKTIKSRRAVLDSATSPKREMEEVKMMASTDKSKARGFNIGSLIQQKIKKKKKLIGTIFGKKKTIKNSRAVSSPKEDIDEADLFTNADTSSTIIGEKKAIKSRGSLFGKVIQKKIQNKKKLFSTIFGKKKSYKNRRAVSDTSATSYFSGIGSFFTKLSSFLPKPKIEMSIKF